MTRPGRQISRKQYEALTGKALGDLEGTLWSMHEDLPWHRLNLHEEAEAQYRQALLAASDIIGCLALEREGRDFR